MKQLNNYNKKFIFLSKDDNKLNKELKNKNEEIISLKNVISLENVKV